VARRVERAGQSLGPELIEALEAVERGEGTCDAVATDLDVSGPEAAAALARLELLGYVSCSLVGVYSRTLLRPPSGI
jgi:Mn-dependent DtxR family transcriptional regulator